MSLSGAEDLHISMTDITQAGYCARGTKGWFERKGLDFRAFLKEGIAAEDLLATEDAMAVRVVESKIQREWIDGDPASLTITFADMKASRKCAKGSRALAARYGLDWNDFLANGISAERLLATGHRDALRVIRDKLERSRRG